VLFVDLVGFTPYSENRDPEEVRALITEYFDMAGEIIGRFGGTVDKFIGDAVMAWWGATVALEDDAERAARAALDVVDAVRALGERVGASGLAARAAVMTGEAAVGPGGNEKGLLLGDLVNSTSRLQSVAAPGTVYVGDLTASRIREAVELSPTGELEVKGKVEPIKAWQAVRVLTERGGRGRADVVEPPFVGRSSELRLLKDLLHATGKEQRARLVSLIGEAGIGKSRLVAELRKHADGLVETVYWHEGRSPAYGDKVSLWALGEMIRRRAGLQETGDDATTREQLSASIDTYIPEADTRKWVRERLESLLGVVDSIGSDRTELFAAARAYFEAISVEGTVVLVFEDLHWADPSLLEFVEELTDWSHNFPILVITMARPDLLERRPDWGSGRRGFTSLRLGPLTDEDMTEMISQMVTGISDRAITRIVSRAAGVPLFAVEMVRILQSDDRLTNVEDAIESMEIPDSIQAVIAARLDRLGAGERELVRDAAVLGHTFSIDGLAALREESTDKIERRLSDLVRKEVLELVRDPRSPEQGQYRWVQSLLKEVAYSRIARSDRHQRHLSAARYYRSLDDPELAPVAASHFVSALETTDNQSPELRSEMQQAVREALNRARTLHANDQVISLVDLALQAVDDEAKPELWEWGATAASRNSDLAKAEEYTNAFLDYARSTGGSMVHHAYALAGQAAVEFRRADRAIDLLEPHLRGYPEFETDPGLARAAVHYARALLLVGRNTEAAEVADHAIGATERHNLAEETADAMVTRGTALSTTRPNQGLALLKGALALCRKHEISGTALRAQINIGYASPDEDESFKYTLSAFEEAKRIGDRSHARFVAGNLIGGFFRRLDLDAAEALLADPILGGTGLERAEHLRAEAQLRARRGDLEAAVSLIEESAPMQAGEADIQVQLNLERTQALVDSMRGDFESGFEIGMRHFESFPFAPRVSIYIASLSAAMLGHRDKLQAVRKAAQTLTGRDSLAHIIDQKTGIVQSLIDGDIDDAIARTRLYLTWLTDREIQEEYLITLIEVANHLPADHPQRESYLAEARVIAEKAGAGGYIRLMDELSARKN